MANILGIPEDVWINYHVSDWYDNTGHGRVLRPTYKRQSVAAIEHARQRVQFYLDCLENVEPREHGQALPFADVTRNDFVVYNWHEGGNGIFYRGSQRTPMESLQMESAWNTMKVNRAADNDVLQWQAVEQVDWELAYAAKEFYQPAAPAPPPPDPQPVEGTIRVVGRTLHGDISVEDVTVNLNGMQTVSRAGDGLFWFDTLVSPGAIITASKTGWNFPPVTVTVDQPDQFYGVQGVPA